MYIFEKYLYFSSFEAGNCVSNSSFKWRKIQLKQFNRTRVKESGYPSVDISSDSAEIELAHWHSVGYHIEAMWLSFWCNHVNIVNIAFSDRFTIRPKCLLFSVLQPTSKLTVSLFPLIFFRWLFVWFFYQFIVFSMSWVTWMFSCIIIKLLLMPDQSFCPLVKPRQRVTWTREFGRYVFC